MRYQWEGGGAVATEVDPPPRWHGGRVPPWHLDFFRGDEGLFLTRPQSSSYLCPVLLGFCALQLLSVGGSGGDRFVIPSCVRDLWARYLRASWFDFIGR